MPYISNPSHLTPATSSADLTDKEGYFVEASAGVVTIVNAATDVPVGVVVNGVATGGLNTIAPPFSPPVLVKLGATPGTVVPFTRLALNADGTVSADPGTGARVVVAVAYTTGAANELIKARIIEPEVHAGA